jgi:type II secretory pathway component PulF
MLMDPEILFIFYTAVILLAATPLVVLRILSAQQKIADNKIYRRVSYICWAVIAVGIAGIIFTTSGELIGMALFIAVIVAVIAIASNFAASAMLRPHRRSRQNALLWAMAVAVEKNIPLVPAIEAFAQGGGIFNANAARLARLLRSGAALPDALDQCPEILPAKTLLAIRVGYESGSLAGALRQAAASRDSLGIIRNSLFTKLFYILLVFTFGLCVVFFLLTKIVPSYEKIFKDFGTDLPRVTMTLIAISHFMESFWYFFLPFYLLIIGALVYYLISFKSGWFYFPGASRLMRRHHAAAILDTLAAAAEGNLPLTKSVAVLAEHYPQWLVREKLFWAGRDINQGADWCESLLRRGLISAADQAVLQAARRAGNLPWAMREMADSNRRRLAYRLNALVQLAYPPVILCLGGCVMFVVVAMFYPLITLISKLAGQ